VGMRERTIRWTAVVISIAVVGLGLWAIVSSLISKPMEAELAVARLEGQPQTTSYETTIGQADYKVVLDMAAWRLTATCDGKPILDTLLRAPEKNMLVGAGIGMSEDSSSVCGGRAVVALHYDKGWRLAFVAGPTPTSPSSVEPPRVVARPTRIVASGIYRSLPMTVSATVNGDRLRRLTGTCGDQRFDWPVNAPITSRGGGVSLLGYEAKGCGLKSIAMAGWDDFGQTIVYVYDLRGHNITNGGGVSAENFPPQFEDAQIYRKRHFWER
jgi:hypothetical protein